MDWKQAKQKLLQDKAKREAYQKVDLGYEIAKMITDARIAKDMTQECLAKLAGTKQPSIARVEKGDSLPSLSFLQKIAKAFNTQLLPPRLEFLEELQRVETESYTVNIYLFPAYGILNHLPLSQLGARKTRLISNQERAFTSNNKEFEYANS